MKYTAILVNLLALMIQGCAGFTTAKTAIAIEGFKVADEALAVSEWGQCEAATVGAIRRKYKDNPQGLKRWQAFCTTNEFAPVIAP